jgi:tetratricopeptide (TPR) repeat protein
MKARRNPSQRFLGTAELSPHAGPSSPKKPSQSPAPPSYRRWFRWLALLSPLLLLALAELGLRLAGYGWATSFFLERSQPQGTRLVENPKFGWRFFPPAVARTPQPLSLAAAKPPDTIRIFVLGESAAMGDPEPAYGFARQLERLLSARDPSHKFEVVNTAMTAINSHVLREIARDCAPRQGDFWVVYAGNNEVVGPFGAGTVFGRRAPGLAFIRAGLLLKSTRLGQWLGSLRPPSGDPQEWRGMEMFLQNQVRCDAPSLQIVQANFARNLAAITGLGRHSGAAVLLATVPVNLRDSPPFASQHRPGLSAAQLNDWNQGFARGCSAQAAGRLAEAVAAYTEAGHLDAEFAELPFRRAVCELVLRQTNAAAADFLLARDLDTLRFRADSRINQTIRRVAAAQGAPLMDAEQACAQQSPGGIPGESLFYDHVHLNFTGNYLVAALFAAEISKQLATSTSPQSSSSSSSFSSSSSQQLIGSATAPWLTEAEVARQLAFTDFDQRRIAQEMQLRLRQPPFASQLNFRTRDDQWQESITRLEASPARFAEAYRAALELAPQDWVLHANYGRLLAAAGEEPAAALQWQAVAQLLPHEPDAWFQLGNLAYNAGSFALAERCFRDALQRKPNLLDALSGLGLALAAQGQTEGAVQEFKAALRLSPADSAARVNLAVVLAKRGQISAAQAEYRTVLQLETNNVAARINLAKLLAAQGRPDEAITLFRQAVALQPDQPVANFDLANALVAQGRHADAIPYYQAAIRTKPDFTDARFNLALEFVRSGQLAEALPQLAEVVRLQPDFVNGRYNYGVALAKRQHYAQAAEQFRAALQRQPDHAGAKAALARVLKLAKGQ